MRKTAFRSVLLLALASVGLWAQAVSGTLSGRVTVAAGTGVPNAAVTITNTDTNVSQRVLTGPDGSFTVAGLPPGTYRVDVETAGFKRTSQQNIELTTTAPATVNITLEAGNMNETVEIKGTAPMIQTHNGELSLGVVDRTVRELPLIDRNFQQLVELQPGITPPQPAYPFVIDPAQNRFFSTNGQQPAINLWGVDGVDNTERFRGTAVRVQPVESVQQMNIVTGSWTAGKGATGGASMQNVMRGGTNAWHGSLFEFNSFDGLRSRSFLDQDPNPKPRFTYNQFGGALGGRLVRDKTFFFGSYEGTYNHGENTILSTVPTPAMAAGDFSAVPGLSLFNPATGLSTGAGRSPFFNNMIPVTSINPTSAALAAALPAPAMPGFFNNYMANTPYQNDAQKFDGRIDQHFSDRTSAFLRYGYSNLHALDTSIFGDALGGSSGTRVVGQNVVANVTHSFSPSFLTEFRFGYNRYDQKLNGDPGALGYSLGFTNGLPGISIPGMLGFGAPAGTPMNGVDNDFNWVWNFAYRTNRHNFHAGVDIHRFRNDGFFNNPSFGLTGSAYFGPGATLSPAVGAFSPYGTFANSFASFLLGTPGATGATAFTETPTIRQSWYGLYLSDNIQVMRRLTVDLGLRWDVFSPLEPRRAGGAMFYDPTFNTINYAGVGDTGMQDTRYDLKNVGPHIGFAFTPNDKTVVRGGYAMNYFQVPYMYTGWMPTITGTSAGVAGTFATAPGTFGSTGTAFTPPAFTGTLTNGLAAPNVPLNVVSRDLRTPYVQSFNLQVQHEFMQNLVLSVGYVGTLGRQLPYVQELNAAMPGTGLAGLPFGAFGRTASTLFYGNGLTNNYNALQVNLSRRFAHGLMFQAAYTYSKALGYTSGTNNLLLNPFDRSANYGPLDYDRQSVLTISHLWDLPFGAGTHHLNQGIVGQIVGNWQINGIFTWATGTPLTITADPLFCNCPNLNVLANINGPVSVSGNTGLGQNFFNTAAFSSPSAGSFGNQGRGSVRGPGFRNYDMSLFRSIPVRDQYKLEIRGEVYNISNTPRWMNPVTNFNSPAFGQVTGSLNGAFGRQFDLAVRLMF